MKSGTEGERLGLIPFPEAAGQVFCLAREEREAGDALREAGGGPPLFFRLRIR
jgi:hypothetical protein